MFGRLTVLLSLLVLAGCASSESVVDTSLPVALPPRIALPDGPLPRITLERTMCYGRCPVYAVQVAGDGAVSFVGVAYVDSLRLHRGSVNAETVPTLVDAFEAIDHAAFDDEFHRNSDLCESSVTDMPAAISTIETASGESMVSHYYGCVSSRLEPLLALEAAIDRLLGTERWVGPRR